KRYRRQDAIGTPFCITIDHQTLEDNAVTIRDRDTMAQERVAIDQLLGILKEKCDMRTLLKQLSV
ncbi:MAG: His/Gly/Thr/Pro-type tRNA ligase C-terminal domain-containing protein, partial [Odoribacter sp.]